jgi:hypothetical protein
MTPLKYAALITKPGTTHDVIGEADEHTVHAVGAVRMHFASHEALLDRVFVPADGSASDLVEALTEFERPQSELARHPSSAAASASS